MTFLTPEENAAQGVRGERSVALVNAARSIHSRVSSALAAALMIALGVGVLAWYYAHALTRPVQARALAQSTATSRAQAEMTLPSLGRITPPRLAIDAPAVMEIPQAPEPSRNVPLSEAHPPGNLWSNGTPSNTPEISHNAIIYLEYGQSRATRRTYIQTPSQRSRVTRARRPHT